MENDSTKTFILGGDLSAYPGQFVMVWLPDVGEKPFSLTGAAPISLSIAAVGTLSTALHQLQLGDFIWLRGPLGHGYQLPTASAQRVWLIGGGYGIAPLHFLAKQLLQTGHHVTVIMGGRSQANLMFEAAFAELGVPVYVTTEDGSAGLTGRVTVAMKQLLINKPDVMYACGPTGMLMAIAQLGEAENIAFQLSWEAHMRCGIGLCGSCEAGAGWLTCLDGPVFNFNPLDMVQTMVNLKGEV